MPRRRRRRQDRLPWLPMAVAAVASAALTTTLFSVQAIAVLPSRSGAIATGTAATTGTLDLRLGAQGAGFDQRVAGLVPGDVVHRYVVLRNAGTLAGRNLTMSLRASPDGVLTTDGRRSKAVRASIALCTGGTWSSARGTCGGRVRSLRGPLPLSALAAGQALPIAGLAPAETLSLRLSLQLPDQDELVVNGRLPTTTVQGQQVLLTWTFGLQQETSGR